MKIPVLAALMALTMMMDSFSASHAPRTGEVEADKCPCHKPPPPPPPANPPAQTPQ